MTDKEIIKALECCGKPVDENSCSECPYHCYEEDCHKLLPQAIDLINRQQAEIENYIKVAEYQQNLTLKKSFEIKELKAEIERLEAEIDKQYEQAKADILGNMADGGESCHWCIDEHRKNAIKEFAEKLKAKFSDIEYVIKTHRKTLPVERVKAEVDAVLQNGCSNIIDKVLKEMEDEDK